MNRIIEEAEKPIGPISKPNAPNQTKNLPLSRSDVICFKAAQVAEDIKARAIIGMTVSGYTGFKLSSFRPKSKIYIFSDHPIS